MASVGYGSGIGGAFRMMPTSRVWQIGRSVKGRRNRSGGDSVSQARQSRRLLNGGAYGLIHVVLLRVWRFPSAAIAVARNRPDLDVRSASRGQSTGDFFCPDS
jgi:hypothetical protein